MNSEKVKEIKKIVRYFADKYMTAQCIGVPKRELFADILTLINELESENERLSSRYRNLEINYNDTYEHYREYEVENQQLKDRIAELEKKNAKLLDSVETVQSNRCVYKCVLTKEHLTKFAKRLKDNPKIKKIVDEGWIVSYVELCNAVDETLKEFIK